MKISSEMFTKSVMYNNLPPMMVDGKPVPSLELELEDGKFLEMNPQDLQKLFNDIRDNASGDKEWSLKIDDGGTTEGVTGALTGTLYSVLRIIIQMPEDGKGKPVPVVIRDGSTDKLSFIAIPKGNKIDILYASTSVSGLNRVIDQLTSPKVSVGTGQVPVGTSILLVAYGKADVS